MKTMMVMMKKIMMMIVMMIITQTVAELKACIENKEFLRDMRFAWLHLT